tara:strand:- start:1294 stop:2706 length:1413 start_codon:yes stop_codon:yes gene_type:complete
MAANCVIEQHPIGIPTPVGQDLIFVVSNQTAVANETKVKFCAEVHIGTTIPNTANSNNLKGVFKTTPNNAGVGMFDLRNVIENYVKADNMASDNSQFKDNTASVNERIPIHLIDRFSLNANLIRYMVIQFYVEYLGATNNGVSDPNVVARQDGTDVISGTFLIFNGYVKHTEALYRSGNNFGYDMTKFILNDSTDEFLTNAPTTQYASLDDYGTMAMISSSVDLTRVKFTYYSTDGTQLNADYLDRNSTNGAWDDPFSAISQNQILHLGCFPANIRGWSLNLKNLIAAGTIQGGYITVQAFNNVTPISQIYTIQLNCPDTKNFESIRLCWLNQWGVWDYYTFTKKSVRTISTQGTTYHQLEGSWNDSFYRPDSFKGGKKSFRMNATEKITMNTDFVSEDDNVMFEELINSPEVYLLKGLQTDVTDPLLNQYVTPVRLTTSSFTRKTVANDRLMQYTFEIEKSKTLRTQSI